LKKDEELLPGQVLLKDDQPISMVPYIAELLDEAEIQVLIYNGDRDLSTCAQGSERMLNGMEWSGHDDWLDLNSYKRALWMVDGYPAGWSKSVKNLDFLIVYNSGHLVPYNVPKQAFDLVTRLVKNKPFGDVTIPVVFDPSVLPQEKKMLSSGSGGRLLPAFFGFLAGGAAVVAYLRFKEKWHQKSSYEVVGDVETEAIS
jgi:carboxypeptidase C (cathepsin A)